VLIHKTNKQKQKQNEIYGLNNLNKKKTFSIV